MDTIYTLAWISAPVLGYLNGSWLDCLIMLVVVYFVIYIVPTWFGFYPMWAYDALLLFETPENSLVVTCIFSFSDKITVSDYQNCFKKTLVQDKRFTQKIVALLGRFYWKDDNNFNIDNHFIAHPEPITKPELEAYVSSKCTEPLSFDKPLYEFHIFENFESGSAVVFRFHHCLSDGVSMLSSITWCADEGSCKKLYMPKGLSKFKHFKILLMTLATSLLLLTKLILKTKNKNSLKSEKLSGTKSISWSDKIILKGIFMHCKEKKYTFNDYLTATVLQSLQECAGTNLGKVTMNVPVSLVHQPEDGSFMKLENNLVVVTMEFPEITEKLPYQCSEIFNELKKSIEPYVNFYTAKLTIALLPKFIMQKMVFYIVDKSTLLFSNAAGPREPVYYSGKKFDRFISMSPNMANCGLSITALSYMNHFTVICYADAAVLKDTKKFIEILSEKLNKINSKYLD